MNILIMGAPGSGKGSVSNEIKDSWNLNHISTGDIFRENIAADTKLGKEAKSYMEKGLLVPDDVTNRMVAQYLRDLKDRKNGYLLDGYPRTLAQAEAFEKMTAGSDLAVDLVLSMDVPEDVLIKRITGRRTCPQCGEIYNIYFKAPQKAETCDLCGSPLKSRADDNEESLKVRLAEYNANTKPVIDFYEDQEKVHHVNADRSFEEIFRDIEAIQHS